METALILGGFILVSWLFYRAKSAVANAGAQTIDNAIAATKARRPTTWWIIPGRLSADQLIAVLSQPDAPATLETTRFDTTVRKRVPVVQCTSAAEADLHAAQTAALGLVRVYDPESMLQVR